MDAILQVWRITRTASAFQIQHQLSDPVHLDALSIWFRWIRVRIRSLNELRCVCTMRERVSGRQNNITFAP
jgi:hypothetical protein